MQEELSVSVTSSSKILSYNKATYSILPLHSIYTYDYYDYFLPLAFLSKNTKVLIIGLGAGTSVIQLLKLKKDIQIEATEIDPEIVRLSWTNDYPSLIEGRFKAIVAEGAEHLKKQESQYDLIIVDAFLGFDIPNQFLQEQFLADAKKALKSGGIFAMNYGRKLPSNLELSKVGFKAYHLPVKNNNLIIGYIGDQTIPTDFPNSTILSRFKLMTPLR